MIKSSNMERDYSVRKRPQTGIQTARRTTIYIVTVILLAIAGILVCALAFLTAERISNLYILATEGMSLRAVDILGVEDSETNENTLDVYFTKRFLDGDQALNSAVYSNYDITSYDYDLSIEKISVWPWSETATVTAVETVKIKGHVKPELVENGNLSIEAPLPEWETARYIIHFVLKDNRWFISDLELITRNPGGESLGTPDLMQSILPMATPTPSPQLFDFSIK